MDNDIAKATFSFVDARNLERARARLSRLKGIRSVGVSILAQMIYVEYDPQEITINKLKSMSKGARRTG